MPLRSDWSHSTCPMARSLEVLGDPWAILILRELFSGITHFVEMRDRLEVADTVLTDRLSRLCDAEVVRRVRYGGTEQRPRHTYHLTEAGAATLPVLHALAQWGSRHRTPDTLKNTELQVWCTTCGNEIINSVDWCMHCQAPLAVAHTSWRRTGRSDDLIDLAAAAPWP
jgi:DNA-binding HxlR family transcriptional regulator